MAQMVESDAALGHAWEKMMCLLKVDASLLQTAVQMDRFLPLWSLSPPVKETLIAACVEQDLITSNYKCSVDRCSLQFVVSH